MVLLTSGSLGESSESRQDAELHELRYRCRSCSHKEHLGVWGSKLVVDSTVVIDCIPFPLANFAIAGRTVQTVNVVDHQHI